MSEMRRVKITKDAKDRGVHESTFVKDNISYHLTNAEGLAVNAEVAAAWVAADTNVTTVAES